MTRRRPLILAASVAAAVAAGIWTGDATAPTARPRIDAAALARFDLARVHARAHLSAAIAPREQRAAALELAGVYRRSARTLPDQQAALHQAASAYEALAAASSPAAYAAGARRALRVDSALANALRRPAGEPGDPLVPPILPLVMLAAAAAGGAVSSRRRRPRRSEPPPPPPPETPQRKPAWDTPPPFGI
jgi:hypothetical protein